MIASHILAVLSSSNLVTNAEVIEMNVELLPRAHKNKPSDFAGAWVMSDEEEGGIKKSLKELWGLWKVD